MVSVRKILQALYYIQSKAPKNNEAKSDIMYLLKLMFFSDRYHLRHFGFVASGDRYVAMKNGPVGSAAKDILQGKMPRSANSAEQFYVADVLQISEYDVVIYKQSSDELSESFRQALEFAVEAFGKFNQFQLSDISHDYPEWKKHEDTLRNRSKSCVEMSFTDFFNNPKSLAESKRHGIRQDPFKENDSEFLKTLKDDFNESSC